MKGLEDTNVPESTEKTQREGAHADLEEEALPIQRSSIPPISHFCSLHVSVSFLLFRSDLCSAPDLMAEQSIPCSQIHT